MSMGRMMAGKPETEKRMGLRPHVVLSLCGSMWFPTNSCHGYG